MKKILFLVAFVATSTLMVAQPRALGLRLGYGIDLSYQHMMSEQNLVSAEFGLRGTSTMHLTATYDWLNPGGLMIPWTEKGTWNWYAGVGADCGFRFPRVAKTDTYSSQSYGGSVGVAGRLGVEYLFWFPLQLAIEYRPVIGAAIASNTYTPAGGSTSKELRVGFDYTGLYSSALALCVRYAF